MAKKKVFISYDHSEDLHYKNLLKAWNSNDRFDFEFDQRSPDVAIDTDEGGRVKAALTTKMKASDYLFVIIGEKSHKSKWMKWEIERAKQSDTKLKLAAVRISTSYSTPDGLLRTGCSFATSFTEVQIIKALDNADNDY